jgi:1,4-dihydroxy-2-naphthoate octaprenyltransferase
MKMKKIGIWIEAIRLRTLPVSVAGVLTGAGFAKWEGCFEWKPAVICFVFAVLAQTVSNLANEYYDYLRGSDKKGRVGPRRGVTEGDIKPNTLRNVTYAVLAITCAVGCCLIYYGGWWMVPVGVAIAIFAIAYSAGPYPLSYHGLGDVAVFLFFGLVPVNFTFYVQAGRFDPATLLASITIGMMAANVLVVNNYRDVEDDKAAGKHTTVVLFGRKVIGTLYLVSGYVAVSMLSPVWLLAMLKGKWLMIAVPVIYLVMHTVTWVKLLNRDGAELNPLLGATARNMLIFAILLIVCFCIYPLHVI